MKIAILRKSQESAVSYYRLMPWLELCRTHGWQAHEFQPKHFAGDTAHLFDALIVSRPSTGDDLMAIVTAKNVGCKVVVDLDDLLWKIPIGNDAFRHYSPDVHEILARGVCWADVVVCSTDELAAEVAKEFGVEAVVIYNRYNDRAIKPQPFQGKKGDKIRILWRGSNTHHTDLFAYCEAFREFENLQFEFFGPVPWYFTKQYGGHLDNVICHSFKYDVLSYFRKLNELQPSYMVFPLEDNEFNRCKSNIAWIEAMQCGAAFIGPSLPQFAGLPHMEVSNVTDLFDYFEHINDNWATANEMAGAYVQTMQKHLVNNFKLSTENQKRYDCLLA